MKKMQVESRDSCVITPTVHSDDLGYFMKPITNDMKEQDLIWTLFRIISQVPARVFCADFIIRKNFPQEKLVRVIRGSVFDVAVDLRKGSETYGKWYGLELSEENKKQFYIPKGFAHGYLVFLVNGLNFCYKCTDFYHPGMMADLFGMILQSVSHGRTSQENIGQWLFRLPHERWHTVKHLRTRRKLANTC